MDLCTHDIIYIYQYKMYELDVVIPVYNHLDLTKQVIKNIEDTQKDVKYRLIIVNDGSSDWTEKWLNNNKKKNWIVIHQENQWTNWARNKWVELATSKYISVINNDILFKEWAFRRFVEWFTDDSIMMVNPRSTTLKVKDYWEKPFYFANHIQWRCRTISKKAKELLFPIDKRLKIFWWDNWLFFKMLYMWYKLKVLHDVVIHHLESQTVDVTKNLDRPIFFEIAKEEWRYVLPVDLKNNILEEDLVFWF